jgi:hypothetical protein
MTIHTYKHVTVAFVLLGSDAALFYKNLTTFRNYASILESRQIFTKQSSVRAQNKEKNSFTAAKDLNHISMFTVTVGRIHFKATRWNDS